MDTLIFAQAAAEPVSETSLLLWYISSCGLFFGLLFILMSIVFVTLAIMNGLAISVSAIVPKEMIEQFCAKLDAKEHQEAYETAKESDSVLGRILASGLVKMSDGIASAEKTINDTAEEEIMRLEHRLSYLATIASVAPMVGLLGTVFGMVEAFQVIAQTGAPQASELAKGIARALVTTQIGLLLAIPALVLFEVFRNRLARLVLLLNIQTENFLKRYKKGV